jgi:hypothetical protein
MKNIFYKQNSLGDNFWENCFLIFGVKNVLVKKTFYDQIGGKS